MGVTHLGIAVNRVVTAFETSFGVARKQKVPCDSSSQLPGESEKLNSKDASACRSVVGLSLCVSREHLDPMLTSKELASNMSSPSLNSVQRLWKLFGHMKHVGDAALRFDVPAPGQFFSNCALNWVLETCSDAAWSSNKDHRKPTFCRMHYILEQCICVWKQQESENNFIFFM